MNKKVYRLNLRLDEDTYIWLKEKARRWNLSMNGYIVEDLKTMKALEEEVYGLEDRYDFD